MRAHFLTSVGDFHTNLGLDTEEPKMVPFPPFQITVTMIKKKSLQLMPVITWFWEDL